MTIKKTLGMAVLATGLFGTGMTAQHVLSKVIQEPVSLTAQQEPVDIKKGYLDGQRTLKDTVVTKDDKKSDTIKAESLEDINLGVSAKPKGVRKELVKQELGHKQTTRQVILDEVDEWVQQETQSAKRIAKAQYNQQLGQETTFVREQLNTVVNDSDFVNYDESTNNSESEFNSINDETSLVSNNNTESESNNINDETALDLDESESNSINDETALDLDESESNSINDETALVLDDLTEANAFGNQFVNNTDYPAGIEISNTPVNNDTLDIIESEVIESEVIESEINESEINESEVIESEVIESEVIESEVIESEINESEVIESDINESEVIESGVIESEINESEVIESEVIESEVIESEVIESEYEEPEYEEPEYEEPVYEEPEYEEPVNSGRPVYPGNLFATAESMIGIPYVWGGRTPEQGFDCSGFVQYVFMETYGIQVGWWTGEQQYAGQLISVEEAQPGDLYFWGTYGGDTTHVAIATGGGSYIHAPQPGSSVGYGSIEWFTPQFAIRVL